MITIVDFGGQLTLLILRRLRELQVQAQIISPDQVELTCPPKVTGVILSGGPASVDEPTIDCTRRVMAWRVPILGICLGHQALAAVSGGELAAQSYREYGMANLSLAGFSSLMDRVVDNSQIWMNHGDSVTKLPSDKWRVIGRTASGSHAAIENQTDKLYGVQFHPESSHTSQGVQILTNFTVKICSATRDFQTADLVEQLKTRINQRVPEDQHVMIACSLGVDSTTVTMLCQQALGRERVHPISVDTGLLRCEDLDLLRESNQFLPSLTIAQERNLFLEALDGVTDSNEKRIIVGNMFWQVFHEHANRLQSRYPVTVLSQGTIAPDVIESAASSDQTAEIKPHHNLVELPDDFPLPLFEQGNRMNHTTYKP